MRAKQRIARYAAAAVAMAAIAIAAATGTTLIAAGAGGSVPMSRPPLPRFPAGSLTAAAPSVSRLAVIVMENKGFRSVIGNRSAPYVNRLARDYGLATRLYAVTHPSLPNYLAITGGSTFGIHSDCVHCRVTATNLVDQLESAGVDWRAYIGGVPRRCYGGASGFWYARAINPFAYYTDVATNPARCARVMPTSRLPIDVSSGHLPRFAWISPDLCDSGHSCGVRRGDRFLSRVVPPLLGRLGPHGILIVTWDEGQSKRGCCGAPGGGRVAAIVAGPDVRRSSTAAGRGNSYAVLRTIEDAFHLPPLRNARSPRAGVLRPLFARAPGLAAPPT